MAESTRSYCQILIGRAMTGLIGLREIFDALARRVYSSMRPTSALAPCELKQHNYVPPHRR